MYKVIKNHLLPSFSSIDAPFCSRPINTKVSNNQLPVFLQQQQKQKNISMTPN